MTIDIFQLRSSFPNFFLSQLSTVIISLSLYRVSVTVIVIGNGIGDQNSNLR